MIRKLTGADIDETAIIWLETNIKAHDFISTEYWKSNFDMVKEMLLQAELYVYESEGSIQGFIGLNDEYIAGLFVSEQAQSHGIGKCLLNFMKDQKRKLSLSVYQKNIRAIHFYQREGFVIQCEKIDDHSGEKEYVMTWEN
ncbi:MAG: GNAT family N-acetyltransferase [Erysipelotrichaceae bacterium]|nr:GNAT family N-acetyltransferase [Erysipelotrichaceae bacterium]